MKECWVKNMSEKVDDEDSGFWQTSDDVPSRLVLQFIGDCVSNKCCISARIIDTKMGGVSSHYNSKGNKIIEDNNRKKVVFSCIECGKEEYVYDDPNKRSLSRFKS